MLKNYNENKMWSIMKKLIKFEEFINEELFGLSSSEKEMKRKKLQNIQKTMELRRQVQEDENRELVSLFSGALKRPINIMSVISHVGGGIEKIKYSDSTKLIEVSPLNKREKEQYDRGKKLTYKESQDFEKKPFMTTVDNIKIYLVDAEHVRNNIDIDYTMGGHGYIYPNYIPENEVWIDSRMNQNDIYATSVHELIERRYMKEQHWTYTKAHEYASKRELNIRKRLEEQENK